MIKLLKVLQKLGGSARGRQFLPAKADEFYDAVTRAMPVSKGDIQIGDMLTRYTPEEYAMMKMFLSPDKQAGYALKGGDELVSVFSTAGGRGKRIASESVLEGARKLDNYDVRGKLPELYGSVGFKETARYPFDPQFGQHLSPGAFNLAPDYVEMAMDPRVASELGRLRGAGVADLERILAGGSGRASRQRGIQNKAAASAALATLLGMGVGRESDV
jgi:hypothetical protein